MREQVELTFLIGYDRDASNSTKEFEQRVIELACKLCGGCAVIPTNGYWMSDGASHARNFSGKMSQEHTLHLKLSCELDKEGEVYSAMRHYISAWSYLFGIDTTWVHVQRTLFTGLHFSTEETRAGIGLARRDIVSPGIG
jgi:hypothetical protein